MTDYAIVNLLEIDDAVEGQGRRPGRALQPQVPRLPRPGRQPLALCPEHAQPGGHSHREQEEAYVVVSGSGRVRLDDEVRDIRQWDVIRVAPEVVRSFESGPDGLELIAVGGPKPEGGDGVRSDAPWPDAGDS